MTTMFVCGVVALVGVEPCHCLKRVLVDAVFTRLANVQLQDRERSSQGQARGSDLTVIVIVPAAPGGWLSLTRTP